MERFRVVGSSHALVVIMHKNGDPDDLKNNRAINLLSQFHKMTYVMMSSTHSTGNSRNSTVSSPENRQDLELVLVPMIF